MSLASRLTAWSLLLPFLPAAAMAATVLPSEGDQSAMRGFPPPAARVVTRQNQIDPANIRWSLTHMRLLQPTANIRRGDGPVALLPRGPNIALPSFADADGRSVAFEQWMRRTNTDALLVLHDGRIVFEGYAAGVDPRAPHTMQSVTKSLVGLAAAALIDEGKLDPDAPIGRYVPELAASAWGTATLRQTLDMETAVRYNEDLKDPNSDVHRYYGVASGSFPPPPDYQGPRNIYEMLERLPQDGEHGRGFIYKTVNPEAVAWVISRVTGLRPSEFISQRIWSQIGAEEDAYVTLDPVGTEMMGGGMSATARDLARFGEMLRLNGRFNGRQIVPATAVQDLFRGGDPEKFRNDPLRRDMVGYSYRDFWWKPPAPGVIEALGGFGQHIHVNRAARTVIVKLSSAPIGARYEEAKRLDPLGFAAIDAMFTSKSTSARAN